MNFIRIEPFVDPLIILRICARSMCNHQFLCWLFALILKILSNGRYKSAEHRVIANSTKARVSVPLFASPRSQTMIGPLPGLPEKDGKTVYRKVKFGEYTANYFGATHQGKKTLDFAKITNEKWWAQDSIVHMHISVDNGIKYIGNANWDQWSRQDTCQKNLEISLHAESTNKVGSTSRRNFNLNLCNGRWN